MRDKELDAKISELEMELERLKEERFIKTAVSYEELLKRERRYYNEHIIRGLDNVDRYLRKRYPWHEGAEHHNPKELLYKDLMKAAISTVILSSDVPFEQTTYLERVSIREWMIRLIEDKFYEILEWMP